MRFNPIKEFISIKMPNGLKISNIINIRFVLTLSSEFRPSYVKVILWRLKKGCNRTYQPSTFKEKQTEHGHSNCQVKTKVSFRLFEGTELVTSVFSCATSAIGKMQ